MDLRIEIDLSTDTPDLRAELFHPERQALVEGAFRSFAVMMAEALGRDVCLGGYRLDEVFRLPAPVHVVDLVED